MDAILKSHVKEMRAENADAMARLAIAAVGSGQDDDACVESALHLLDPTTHRMRQSLAELAVRKRSFGEHFKLSPQGMMVGMLDVITRTAPHWGALFDSELLSHALALVLVDKYRRMDVAQLTDRVVREWMRDGLKKLRREWEEP